MINIWTSFVRKQVLKSRAFTKEKLYIPDEEWNSIMIPFSRNDLIFAIRYGCCDGIVITTNSSINSLKICDTSEKKKSHYMKNFQVRMNQLSKKIIQWPGSLKQKISYTYPEIINFSVVCNRAIWHSLSKSQALTQNSFLYTPIFYHLFSPKNSSL